jgi:hypothetical protein
VRSRLSLVARLRSGDSYALVLALLLSSLFFGILAPQETWGRVLRDTVLAGTVVVVVRVVQPQAARAHVWLDVHREELLAAREAHDRLERPQELEVSRGRGGSEFLE